MWLSALSIMFSRFIKVVVFKYLIFFPGSILSMYTILVLFPVTVIKHSDKSDFIYPAYSSRLCSTIV